MLKTLISNWLAGLVVSLFCLAPQAEAGLCPGISIPAYFYPGSLWTTSIASAPRTAIMIMNPASGPGHSRDPNYVSVVKGAQVKGIKILGYVYTNYGTRPMNEVKGEIDLYKLWYGVNGIFLDETNSGIAKIAYYKIIADYIRAKKGGFVMLNPGIIPNQEYIKIADTTVIFEEAFAVYQSWIPPSWVFNYPAEKFTHLVHTTTTSAQMAKAVALSISKNAGSLYITNDKMDNPWDSLPTYWQTELNTITVYCRQ